MTNSKNNGHKRAKKIIRVFLLMTLLAGATALWLNFRQPSTPSGIIEASGRLESDEAALAAKTSGRVREIGVREGDLVKAGQVIAVLDDDQANARVGQAQSDVEQAEAKLQSTRQQVSVLQAQLEQCRLSVNQARVDAEGRVSQAEAQVAEAEASLARAEADSKLSRADAERFTKLADNGYVPARDGEQARSTAEAQAAIVQAARRQVEAACGALHAAKASLDNPAIRAAQAASIEQQIRQAQADIQSAEAANAFAKAKLHESQADHRDLRIVAPIDGIVATRSVEPGEIVAPGTVIVTIFNPQQVYLRAFIPEGDIGRVRTGQPARVYLDSNPKQPLDAVVARIDPQASFTPENTYFQDDRVKQVVGVKLQLVNAQGFAKPGMPADGEVLVEGDQWAAAKQ